MFKFSSPIVKSTEAEMLPPVSVSNNACVILWQGKMVIIEKKMFRSRGLLAISVYRIGLFNFSFDI